MVCQKLIALCMQFGTCYGHKVAHTEKDLMLLEEYLQLPPPPPIQNSTPYQMQMAVEEGGSESWSGINYERSPAVVAHYG